ncbi:predicted protein [Nematostella vectensis]|uniref:RING-type domain-containing protein n=1 Tax=Nematostella vectensis TaxID=45351 RepID=A7T9A1_NEMVE|nr:predicted protein [Nematostella vectensis]|eukprot:XP_001619526.1 hypothetical protein NEMVEDRAFT_v1g224093 [Nematostella vectensis]
MADPSPVPSGYDSEFVIAVAEEYTCRICHLPLRVPVQTKCGHRFCKECLDEASRRKSRAECPMDREPLDLKKDVFLDKAAERTILSFLVKCPCKGCKWEAELRDLEVSMKGCGKLRERGEVLGVSIRGYGKARERGEVLGISIKGYGKARERGEILGVSIKGYGKARERGESDRVGE